MGYWDVGQEGQKIVGYVKNGAKNSKMWEKRGKKSLSIILIRDSHNRIKLMCKNFT